MMTSGRSPGAMSRVPSVIRSSRFGTDIAATRMLRTGRWRSSGAPVIHLPPSRAASCSTDGWRSAGSSGTAQTGWGSAPPNGRWDAPASAALTSSISDGCGAVDHHRDQVVAERFLPDGGGVDDLVDGAVVAVDDGDDRCAEVAGEAGVRLELDR
jgi:hypothetical protein